MTRSGSYTDCRKMLGFRLLELHRVRSQDLKKSKSWIGKDRIRHCGVGFVWEKRVRLYSFGPILKADAETPGPILFGIGFWIWFWSVHTFMVGSGLSPPLGPLPVTIEKREDVPVGIYHVLFLKKYYRLLLLLLLKVKSVIELHFF